MHNKYILNKAESRISGKGVRIYKGGGVIFLILPIFSKKTLHENEMIGSQKEV